MATYKYIRDSWKKPKASLGELMKERLIEWRREPVTVRIHRPTRLDRARSLGYKAKQGIIVVRQRVMRGGRMRPKSAGGRRPKAFRRTKVLDLSYQVVAEMRAASKYRNCEVLNSYPVAEDGIYKWYEVILVDVNHPAIKKNATLRWVTKGTHTGRAHRGLTSAARSSRGLYKKGKGAEKIRPSLGANKGRH